MKYTEREVLQFVEENDVKFVKLMFCDIYGQLKTVSIISSDLAKVFSNGFALDASKLDGFVDVTEGELRLFPDPDTLALLPWRPQQGRVVRFFCNIKKHDGTPYEGDGRQFLIDAVKYARSKNYIFMIGTSCEFYVFETDDNGMPTSVPHDYAGYCDVAPADRGENLRRDICLTLEKMDIAPESSRHESGPGQNEIDFQSAGALAAADNLITFKNVVKSVANRNGMYATFMPKPLPDNCGSGLHIYLSCINNGKNIFRKKLGDPSPEAKSMLAGILNRISEMTLFFNGTTNSYSRFGKDLAPKYVSWTNMNYPQLIKTPLEDSEDSEILLRSPDNTCNPYFALGLLIYACMEGVECSAKLCDSTNFDLRKADEKALKKFEKLPSTLEEAINKAEKSEFLKKYIPESVLEFLLEEKRRTWKEQLNSENPEVFDYNKYFYSL